MDDQGASMYLEYQNQNSHQTLREAIDEYHRYLTHIGRQILTDSPEDTDHHLALSRRNACYFWARHHH